MKYIGYIYTGISTYNGRVKRKAYVQVWKNDLPIGGQVIWDRSFYDLTPEQYARFQRLQNAVAAGRGQR